MSNRASQLSSMPDEVIELTNSFMNKPESILVKEALTLEGITQFYINIKVSDWKYDILKDLYDTGFAMYYLF